MSSSAQIQAFFDSATWTVSYVVWDPATRAAAIIDPVLDYDAKSGQTRTESASRLLEYLTANRLELQWILETHAHADHLSSAQFLRERAGGRIAIGEHIRTVQRTFAGIFNLGQELACDGKPFDELFADGQTFRIGSLEAQALWVPGHTPADMAYRIGGAVFVGDTLFMPDVGTARADFPGGDARQLYRSMRRLLELPPETVLYVCHDYPPAGRSVQWQTTVAAQRAANLHVRDGVSEDEFVKMRQTRDATLDAPTLILPAIQVNIRAGRLPEPESNGVSYLKIPVNVLGSR